MLFATTSIRDGKVGLPRGGVLTQPLQVPNRLDKHRKDRGDKVVVTGVIGLSAAAHAALKAVKKRPTDASNVELPSSGVF